jgi:hypothetical protein
VPLHFISIRNSYAFIFPMHSRFLFSHGWCASELRMRKNGEYSCMRYGRFLWTGWIKCLRPRELIRPDMIVNTNVKTGPGSEFDWCYSAFRIELDI